MTTRQGTQYKAIETPERMASEEGSENTVTRLMEMLTRMSRQTEGRGPAEGS